MSRYINLVNPALLPRRVAVSAARVAIAAAVVAAAAVAWGVIVGAQAREALTQAQSQAAQLSAGRERLAALGKQLAGHQPDAALARQVQKAETVLRARREVIAALETGAAGSVVGFSGVMRALARQSVDGLWLTGVRLASQGKEVILDGRALDPELVPAYIRRLNAEPEFRGREFAALRVSLPEVKGAPGEGAPPAPPRYVEFSLASTEAKESKR